MSRGLGETAWRWGRSDRLHDQMADMIYGYMVSQIIRVVADVGIADLLAHGPLTASEIAERADGAPDGIARLLRACTTLNLVEPLGGGQYRGTELLDTLRADTPKSLRGMALGATNNSHWSPWLSFGQSVRTGESQVGASLGMSAFDYLQQHPDQGREFTSYMASITSLWALDIAEAIDTTNTAMAVDVGGASGALLRELQRVNPQLHGIVFDRPDVAADVEAALLESEYRSRTTAVGGDFFTSVPPGDLYLLKFILHDWGDAECVQILTSCRAAIAPGGRVAIIELIVGDHQNPGVAALMDLNMLALTGGRERSLAEYDALLDAAGFTRTATYTRPFTPQGVIEAVPKQ